MLTRIFTVGGLTLVSRVTGFARDIMLAAILGAGPIADAFFVALRLPNHFRAIFAEGAFNAAFVPAYARVRAQNGAGAAHLFLEPGLYDFGGGRTGVGRDRDPVHAGGDRLAGAGIFRRSTTLCAGK